MFHHTNLVLDPRILGEVGDLTTRSPSELMWWTTVSVQCDRMKVGKAVFDNNTPNLGKI
ncbi:hypothetical protein H6G81_35120 [Scytonema hofmannii FACHB-248]|uniref:Uncharacterized protein n=1 Tax=Scytonema hofmannii FACHB-248 TaxID=1842502 RepID=A0ABR8H226_9CYAN|nr:MULTISPECIES: hypothetical protein [Nostocales]MBD2609584.1 hypothetical protein [Scytonema hofmannii FACHB-248]